MTTRMKKLSPGFLHVSSSDHLPPKNRLRVQVVTNSKGYLELNLNGRDLRAIPPETFQLTATHVLRLAHNHIDSLPLMIAYLRVLKVLDLQHNLLPSLPETLVNCRQLAELYLTANRLAELPKSIGGLTTLRVLTLGENQFEQLPQEVGLMTSLRLLDIHGNKLWHLPFSLQELKHLTQLDASDNMFDHVPLVITKITSLQKLNLAKNRLASLPVDLDALRGLHQLNLSHNSFVSISSLVTSLKHLKYLSLANNRLKFLPPQMSHLQNLRVLHVQHNCLRHVPSQLRCLQFFNVSGNQLASFSVEGMRNLVSLSASSNNLDTVPRGLYKLKKLKFLYLDNNQLVELHEDVRHLKELRVLDLSNNHLVSLPRCLHRLAKLQGFNVKGNHKLKQPEEGDEESKTSTVDSKSLKHKTQSTKKNVVDQQHKTDEHNYSVNMSESRNKEFANDVTDGNVRKEKNESDSKNRQFTTAGFNENNGHSSVQMSKIPSDLEMYAKPGHRYNTGHEDLRGLGVSVPNTRVDRKLYKEQTFTRSTLPKESESQAPKKVSSLQYLRYLLFGVSKKTKSRSDVAGSLPTSHRLSEKSIHFEDSAMSSRDRGTRNFPAARNFPPTRSFPATRNSTISRNSSSPWSHRKPACTRSIGPDGSGHEPLLTNRIHFNIPGETRDNMDAKSDSHGYGTWRSRHGAPVGYFDSESLDYAGSSSYGGADYIQPSPNVDYNAVRTPGHGDYNHAVYGPNMDFYFSDDTSYCEGDSRNRKSDHHHTNKNTRQFYNNSDTGKEWCRNKHINSGCHCSSSNKIHTLGRERSGNDKRRNSFDRNSSISTYMTTQDRSSFVSGANGKATGRQGGQHRHGQPGFTSQSQTTLHKSCPESTPDNSNKRMTIPQVGCWFRDGRVSSPTFFNECTDQCQVNYCCRGHSHRRGEAGEPYQPYKSAPASDVDHTSHSQNHQNYMYRSPSNQKQDQSVAQLRGNPRTQSESDHGATLNKNCLEFDHVLKTTAFIDSEINQNDKVIQRNCTSTSCLRDKGDKGFNFGDNFTKGRKPNPRLGHSRSVDSLTHLASRSTSVREKSVRDRVHAAGGDKSQGLVRGSSEQSLAHSDDAQTMASIHQSGTDYNLLGVCNQVETLLNKNLLQPVIGYQHRGRHSFAEKTIRENAQGLWRMDNQADLIASYNNENDDNIGAGDDGNDDDDDLPGLEYTQPQTFTVSSKGGQFVSSAGPQVKICIPAHATADPLHISIQLMFVPSSVIAKAKELNYFVNNIVAMGPVVYFNSDTETKMNSQATVTIPAPAEIKGAHLTVLTVRKDNSCIPCSSGYRSGKLAATFTTWQFVGKVAFLTQAKCKYKACKSMEQLLQCVGATQI